MNNFYNDKFFADQKEGSFLSAQKIVPLIIELIHPTSVVDVGCGVGTWIKAFEINGVKEVLGIDGSYVNTDKLLISPENFLSQDLSKEIKIDKKFSLAISLEVAEHIEKKHAETFVKSLVGLSEVIVFSAAVPKQGGTNHVNEQWPEYWEKIFAEQDYQLFDPFRDKIRNIEGIEWWYKQNILLAVSEKSESFEKFQNLPLYNSDFITLYYPVFRRNVLSLRLKNIIKKTVNMILSLTKIRK